MLQLRLGSLEPQPDKDDSFLPRTFSGWHQGMTAQQIYTSGRGWWRLSLTRARHERYAVVVADGIARQVIEITEWATHPKSGRHAFSGIILTPGHSVHDRYIGKAMDSRGQNPVRYISDTSH
jgi:hypothetical protein